MTVLIGSARINEKGTTAGGKPGDQTGGEVSVQNWYLHSKGWIVIRAKDPKKREKIAKCMEMACTNNKIGYCQTHRGTLTAEAKQYNYDVSKVQNPVEVDCSELVRVCCLYAGISIGTFTTANELQAIKSTGEVWVYTDDAHCRSSVKLLRGDILVTKTKGHTVVALSNGKDITGSSSDSSNSFNGVSIKLDMAQKFDKGIAGTYVVNTKTDPLALRTGAGKSKTKITNMPKGSRVICYGYYTVASETKWLYVVYGSYTGFCSANYLKKL